MRVGGTGDRDQRHQGSRALFGYYLLEFSTLSGLKTGLDLLIFEREGWKLARRTVVTTGRHYHGLPYFFILVKGCGTWKFEAEGLIVNGDGLTSL